MTLPTLTSSGVGRPAMSAAPSESMILSPFAGTSPRARAAAAKLAREADETQRRLRAEMYERLERRAA